MNKNILNRVLIFVLSILIFSLNADLTINYPENGQTITGENFIISGSSSYQNYTVRIFINGTQISNTQTEADGSWTFTYPELNIGFYSVRAEIVGIKDGGFCILESKTSDFTVAQSRIKIITPSDGAKASTYCSKIEGRASEASALVNIKIDGVLIATTNSDELGNWEADYPPLENGQHILLAELESESTIVATHTITFNSVSPILTPLSNLQLRIIEGNIPTSGSGSGNGFNYSVAGTTATIDFTKAFSALPTILATGQYASGTSTITISDLSTTTCELTFSAGTERVHFSAKEFL